MDKNATIQELINQASNTRHLVLAVAAAYRGTIPDNIVIATKEPKEGD